MTCKIKLRTACKRFWLLVVMLAIHSSLSAQSEFKRSEDSIKYYLEIVNDNWHGNSSLLSNAAQRAYMLALEVDNPLLTAEATAQYGVFHYTNSAFDSAIIFYHKAVNIALLNKIPPYQYAIYLSAALEKKGKFSKIDSLISKIFENEYEKTLASFNLLLVQLKSSLTVGTIRKSDSLIHISNQWVSEINSETAMLNLQKLTAVYYSQISQYSTADSIYENLLIHYSSINNKMDQAETLKLLAKNKMELSKYKLSTNYLLQARTIYDSLNYTHGIAQINLFTGSLFSWMGRYNEASEYLFKALEQFNKNENINDLQITYYELGWVYFSTDLTQKAKKYLGLAIEIARKIENQNSLGNIHNAYGSLYARNEINDSAIFHFDSAIYYHQNTQNKRSWAAAQFNKAVILEKMGNSEDALLIYRKTYAVDRKLNFKLGMVEGEWVLGNFFLKNGQIDSAKYYLNLGENRAVDLKENYFKYEIYQSQSDLALKLNQQRKSIDYLKKVIDAQKEMTKENITLELATLDALYDIKTKERELKLLSLQKINNEQTIALNQKTISAQRNTLILLSIGFILLVILSYIIFRYLKIKTKTNQQLKELNNEIQEKQEEIIAQSKDLKLANNHVVKLNGALEEKVKERTEKLTDALSELDNFFYRASHDFRGPLTTLMGLVSLSKNLGPTDETELIFNKIAGTVDKLDKMVKKLQIVSSFTENHQLPPTQEIEIKTFINKICLHIKRQKIDKDIACSFNVTTNNEKVIFHPFVLEICLTSLLENSVNFNDKSEINIQISTKIDQGKLEISVTDNGVGIPENLHQEIFHMFKRTSNSSKGNGLGLYIVKKAVDRFKGNIVLESKLGEGSTFTLTFPLT